MIGARFVSKNLRRTCNSLPRVGSRLPQELRRHRSSTSVIPSVSAYEYPTRTEPPDIKITNASEISLEEIYTQSSPRVYSKEDPFDDQSSLSAEERQQRKTDLKESIDSLKLSSFPISDKAPDFIPPNVASTELEAPETLITTLDNGLRVVSQETYGQMTTVGVLANVGSRHETTPGTVHMLETMAFGSTKNFDGMAITQLLQDWGATRFVSHSREQCLHCVDILRPNVHQGVELLADVVLEPRISASLDEFNHALDVMAFQAQEQLPELDLGEAIQMAAYGEDQQLGKLHFATSDTIPLLSPEVVENFFDQNIRNNPKNMVVAGAGIAHNELVDMAKEYFGSLSQLSAPTTIDSVYRGGSHHIPKALHQSVYSPISPEEQYCRVALAFPVGGWHSDTMVTACVLQMLLGGGSSFSAGGPGKGMYSRMYQQVLNRYGFLESAEAFTTFADEAGLFGVSASTAHPKRVADLVSILADQLAQLAVEDVSDVELSRARNMLKCNVLTQLESRLILFEDIGRQILTYGKRENAATTCAKIDSVTAEDIRNLAQTMLKQRPTLAATGSHTEFVPEYDKVLQWFQAINK